MKLISSAPTLTTLAVVPALILSLTGCGGGGPDPAPAAEQPAPRLAAVLGGAPKAEAPAGTLPFGTTAAPTIDNVKVIASDGAGIAYITNQWGGHQARITRHRDGVVRVLYIRPNGDSFNTMAWRVMARSPGTGEWKLERSGETSDDVNLLRDPVTDTAFVLAYPNSAPTVYVLPTGEATPIPGVWAFYGPDSRHYSAAGIGADGTLCFKASLERPSLRVTGNTETELVCGNYKLAGGWHWNAWRGWHIGNRHAYDYLFPGGFGNSGQLVATAQSDLRKEDAGFPGASQAYVFNGMGIYMAATSGAGELTMGTLKSPYSTPNPLQATQAPQARMQDSFNDSRHRVISTYYAQPGSQASTPERGFYTVIANPDGSILPEIHWARLPQYGSVRIFEDGSKRMWLLWTGQGTTKTQMKLYALNQNPAGPALSLGSETDFGKPFGEYSIDGSPHLALTSKGQVADNLVEGMFAACEETYATGRTFRQPYYPSGNGSQRIIYFRIHLPN